MESLAKRCHLKSDNPRFVPGTALMREYGADVRAGLLEKLKRDVADFMIAEENDSHALLKVLPNPIHVSWGSRLRPK